MKVGYSWILFYSNMFPTNIPFSRCTSPIHAGSGLTMDSLDFPKKSLAAIYGSLGSVTSFMEKCYHWRKKSAAYPWKFQNMGHKICNESDSTSWFQAIGVQSIHLHDLWDRLPGTNASYIYRQGRRTAQFSHCPSTGQTKAMSWQSTPLIQSLDTIILGYLL